MKYEVHQGPLTTHRSAGSLWGQFGRPEHIFVACAARRELSPAVAERMIELTHGRFDWHYAVETALGHRLGPLLLRHLSALSEIEVCEGVLARLREHAHAVTLRNMSQAAELHRLLGLFSEQGIPAIPLKGPVLGLDLYGDIALRPFYDLDILVRRADVQKCKALLTADGYRPDLDLSASDEEHYLDAQFAYCMVREDGPIPKKVELHWALTHRFFSFHQKPEELWERAAHLSFGGVAVPSLATEDLILFLCMHATKHQWCQLILISDVAEMLRTHPKFSWEALFSRARSTGGRRALCLGLFLAHHISGGPLPDKISEQVHADGKVKQLADHVGRWLFTEESGIVGRKKALQFDAHVRERHRDRLSMYLHHARLLVGPSDKDRKFVELPAQLSFLQFLVRPIRALREIFIESSKAH